MFLSQFFVKEKNAKNKIDENDFINLVNLVTIKVKS